MKKILLGLGGLGAIVTMLPMLAAFEAHVVNVTATIENALSVPQRLIEFGTVFPQEHLDRSLLVALSRSFQAEEDADDVEYIIRQKPKCAWSWQDAAGVWNIDEQSTQTGHPKLDAVDVPYIDCGVKVNVPENPGDPTANPPVPPTGDGIPDNAKWGPLPLLCNYISKHPDGVDDGGVESDNDGSLNSFHQAWTWNGRQLVWTDTSGRLAKSDNDTSDNWTIDLAVPCFGGYCAQDWADFVHSYDPQADPNAYTQPIENEHKVFGCDLWVEVTGVSRLSGQNSGTSEQP